MRKQRQLAEIKEKVMDGWLRITVRGTRKREVNRAADDLVEAVLDAGAKVSGPQVVPLLHERVIDVLDLDAASVDALFATSVRRSLLVEMTLVGGSFGDA